MYYIHTYLRVYIYIYMILLENAGAPWCFPALKIEKKNSVIGEKVWVSKRMTGRKKADRLKKIMCGDDSLCLWEYTGMILALQSPKKCHITWYWTGTLKTWFLFGKSFLFRGFSIEHPDQTVLFHVFFLHSFYIRDMHMTPWPFGG